MLCSCSAVSSYKWSWWGQFSKSMYVSFSLHHGTLQWLKHWYQNINNGFSVCQVYSFGTNIAAVTCIPAMSVRWVTFCLLLDMTQYPDEPSKSSIWYEPMKLIRCFVVNIFFAAKAYSTLNDSIEIWKHLLFHHYGDVIMGAIASQITSLTIVYSTVYSDADQRKHQSSASLAFLLGIHRGPVNSPHKWPVTRKMFPFDDVIMRFTDYLPKYYLLQRPITPIYMFYEWFFA